MKTKITYLFLILPLLTFAQGPWEFNTAANTEGWGVSQGSTNTPGTLSATGTAIEYTTITGNSQTARNPTFTNTTANVDATINNQIEVSVKNGSGSNYLRLSATIGGVATTYYNLITAGDTGYKIYTFTLTSTGTITSLSLEFRLSDGTASGSNNYVPQAAPSTVGTIISIDYIKPKIFVAPIQNSFNFDTTVEGFDKTTRASAVPATESGNSTLEVKYVSGTNNALSAVVALNSSIARVEGTNKYAHVTLKNTTTNDQFQLKGKVATLTTVFPPIQTYTTSDAVYKTYDFNLTTWDSGNQFPELAFAVKDTWSAAPTTYATNDIVVVSNTYYKSKTGDNSAVDAAALKLDTINWELCNATGEVAPAVGAVVGGALDMTNSIYIDSIVFDNTDATLGTADFGYTNNTISLYPNPANDVLNISSSNSITSIEVYDLLGKKVASNENASNVNVADLGKGAYIVKVVQENGSVAAKQFIKE